MLRDELKASGMTYGCTVMLRDELNASGRLEVSAYHIGGCEGHRPLGRDAVQTGENFTVVRWVSTPCILLG